MIYKLNVRDCFRSTIFTLIGAVVLLLFARAQFPFETDRQLGLLIHALIFVGGLTVFPGVYLCFEYLWFGIDLRVRIDQSGGFLTVISQGESEHFRLDDVIRFVKVSTGGNSRHPMSSFFFYAIQFKGGKVVIINSLMLSQEDLMLRDLRYTAVSSSWPSIKWQGFSCWWS